MLTPNGFVSDFKFYSIGLVAEDKPLTTNDILAVPVEILPLLDGVGVGDTETLEASGEDAQGKTYNVTVQHRNAIHCKWLPFGSNRRTAPDVRFNERVLILRHADQDCYYWMPLGLDEHLRRLETAIYYWNANPDGETEQEPSIENSYYLEISTHKKMITFHTTKLNEEPFEYTLQFNMDEGVITLTDDVNNFIEFDSSETKITAHNAEGTYISLNKKDIFVYAPNNIDVEAVETIEMRCKNYILKVGEDAVHEIERDVKTTIGNDLTVEVGGNVSETISGNQSVEIGGNHSEQCSAYTLNASSASIEAGTISLKGSVDVDGAMTTKAITSSADIKALNVEGMVSCKGPKGSW